MTYYHDNRGGCFEFLIIAGIVVLLLIGAFRLTTGIGAWP